MFYGFYFCWLFFDFRSGWEFFGYLFSKELNRVYKGREVGVVVFCVKFWGF